jgi:hypothetical protein
VSFIGFTLRHYLSAFERYEEEADSKGAWIRRAVAAPLVLSPALMQWPTYRSLVEGMPFLEKIALWAWFPGISLLALHAAWIDTKKLRLQVSDKDRRLTELNAAANRDDDAAFDVFIQDLQGLAADAFRQSSQTCELDDISNWVNRADICLRARFPQGRVEFEMRSFQFKRTYNDRELRARFAHFAKLMQYKIKSLMEEHRAARSSQITS